MPSRRVILVTGASSGIGRATAHLLAERGEHLLLMARGVERLDDVAQECLVRGAASALTSGGDVTDRAAVEGLVAIAVSTYGRLDGVVNSAGVAAYGLFTDIEPAVLERVVSTNFLGTANVARAALRQFTAQGGGGSLVLVGSLLGKIATPYMAAYLTSKWAVHGLARALQLEARQTPGVHVTLVSPGGVDTPIYRWAASTGRQGQPPPPVDAPERVARAIVRALDHPRREISVGLANHLTVFGFRAAPGLFDSLVTPLMGRFGLDPEPVAPHRGNVFSSQPDASTAPYGHHDSRLLRLTRRLLNALAATASGPKVRQPTATQTPESLDSANAQPGVLVQRQVNAGPEAVWAVLADGWLYANWVVGASRTRDVDSDWPKAGSRIQHSFGIWPAVLNDTSQVLKADPPTRLLVLAQGWPLGAAHVDITLEAQGDGTTLVSLREDAVAGPGLLAPRTLRQLLIVPRNKEALRRLSHLAEGGAADPSS